MPARSEREIQLSASEDWCVLNEVDLSQVEQHSVERLYQTGEALFREGDAVKGVYYVQSGLVGVRKADPYGNPTLLKLAWPGDTLGYRPLLANQCHRASAEAFRKGVVCFVDSKTVLQLIEATPALGLNFLKRAAKELGDAEQRFHDSVTLDMRTRFAHLLLVMQQQQKYVRGDSDGSAELLLPISRSDIAAMLGVRRETVSRAIRVLEESGVAYFSQRQVLVPDPASLTKTLVR